MKVLNTFNNNFGALLGKKEVTTFHNKDGSMNINTVQLIHPFKGEFKSEEDKNNWLEEFKKSCYYLNQNGSAWGVEKKYEIKIAPELPFSEDVFKKAKADGVQLLFNPDEFYSVTTKNIGYYPSVTFSNGKFDCLA